MLNTDAMGVCGPARRTSRISGTAKLDLLDDADRRGQASRAAISLPDPHPEAGGFYRSDHFSFAKVGVPAISFDSGNDLVNGGIARGEALADDYIAKRYHQPDDEWSPDWDFSGMAEDAELLHAVGAAARQLARMAELEPGQRIPRRPRRPARPSERRGSAREG